MDSINNEEMIEIDLREYARLLWYKKWLILAILAVALIAAFILSSRITPIYQTSTLVMVEEDASMGDLFGDSMPGLARGSDKIATYTEIIRSRRVLNQVIEQLELINEDGELIRAGSLRGKINVSRSGDANLLEISAEYDDPQLAKKIANTVVEVFQEENQSLNQASLANATDFVNQQVTSVRSDLTAMEDDLLDYKTEEGVSFPQEQGRAVLDKLINLESQKEQARLEIAEAESRLEQLRNNLAQEDEWIITSRNIRTNPLLENYRQSLSELEIELSGLEEKYTERHPQVRETQRKIAELEERIAASVGEVIASKNENRNPSYQNFREEIINSQTRIIVNQTRIDVLAEQIIDLEEELGTIPQQELTLARLEREASVAENVYTMLRERREELEIQKAMQTSDMLVIDEALTPRNPIRPRTTLNLAIAFMLGLMLAIGIIFLIEFLDTTLKEEKDVERLTDLSVLGVIPDMDKIDHSSGYGRGE